MEYKIKFSTKLPDNQNRLKSLLKDEKNRLIHLNSEPKSIPVYFFQLVIVCFIARITHLFSSEWSSLTKNLFGLLRFTEYISGTIFSELLILGFYIVFFLSNTYKWNFSIKMQFLFVYLRRNEAVKVMPVRKLVFSPLSLKYVIISLVVTFSLLR